MKTHLKNILLMLTLLSAQTALANAIDSLENQLRENQLFQEKIYVHTDNNSYFVGDTIWYKAYLLRADDLRPAAMSKILYVELLSPDGYIVERQRIIVDHNTQSYGQFALPDTIYSGYYELRAYTRWQMNFNVTHRPHSTFDDRWFFNKQLAKDYFRDYEGLYSRVFPIYEKPEQAGDYGDKRIIDRPKRRLAKEQEGLDVKFFPEGGSLVAGVKSRVAFEVLDANGQPLKISGTLANGTKLQTNSEGRGIFSVQPNGAQSITAKIQYDGKEHSVRLPEVLEAGAVITYDAIGQKAEIMANGVAVAAVSVTCRGKFVAFERGVQTIDTKDFPTGVNEIIAYDAEARPLATRQIFVNRNDIGQKIDIDFATTDGKKQSQKEAVAPFQQLGFHTQIAQQDARTFSVAICDQRGDEPTFDDGNILTDLLLSGDLRGFVAHPARYFEADDSLHRAQLDLLMMIQGWRKYAPLANFRYLPERTFAVEGEVFKIDGDLYDEYNLMDEMMRENPSGTLDANPCFTIDGNGRVKLLKINDLVEENVPVGLVIEETTEADDTGIATADYDEAQEQEAGRDDLRRERRSHKLKRLKDKVLVEAELNKGKDVAGVIVEADSMGAYIFQMPPFYDKAILFMTAYAAKDSTQKNMASLTDKKKMDPFVSPDYYVRQETFYPIFSQPYAWLQTHSPEDDEFLANGDNPAELNALGADHVLDNITVKRRRRRPLRSFDRSKPAFVIDFATLLNEATDRGLHYNYFNSIAFWAEAARTLFGNMNDPYQGIGIRADVNNHTFLRTFRPSVTSSVGDPMTPATLQKRLDPRNILQVRVFTDYDMRNGIGKEENRGMPDVFFEVIPIPNDNRRAMRRDRRLVIDGFAYPEQFYNRDYSGSALPDSSDYRRTLYWNPNAHTDEEGNLNVTFFNGARPAHLKVSVCGVGNDGKVYYY